MKGWLLVGLTGKVMVEFMGKVVVESKYMVLDMESICSMGNTVGFLGTLVLRFKGVVQVRFMGRDRVLGSFMGKVLLDFTILELGWSEGLKVVLLNKFTNFFLILISRENGVSEITKLRLDCFTCFRIWSQMSWTVMTAILKI